MPVTAKRLRSLLHYDPTLGMFMWLVAPQISAKVKPGDVAGRVDSKGYVRIGVDGGQYRAHRLAWLYMTGSWPPCEIDHENRQRSDNRWLNLREATCAQNRQNITPRGDNTSGRTGVSWSSVRAKWVAQITVAGRRRTLGSFDTMDEAIAAREAAEQTVFTHATKHRGA